jgi:outer membrane protein assembly factor BamD
MLTFRKRPDMAQTARVGEPTLVDPRPTNAPEIVRHAGDVLSGKGDQQLSIEQVGTGTPPANAPVPRSDAQGGANAPQADSNAAQQVDPNAPQSTPPQQDDGIQSLTPMAPAQTPAAPQQTPPTQTPGVQQPPAAPAQPASTVQQSAPEQPAVAQSGRAQATPNAAPPQVNDAKGGDGDQAAASSDTQTQDDSKNVSSSKKKKKKGLGKLNPF